MGKEERNDFLRAEQEMMQVGDDRLVRTNTNVKDSVFRRLFSDKERLLSLYNALNGSSYDDPEELEIISLENAVYLNVRNDLAFLFIHHLMLYEHQATWCVNIPLRGLFYFSSMLSKIRWNKSIYSKMLIKLPTPKFVVFYNGTDEDIQEKVELKLSDAYEIKDENPALELKAQVYNVNYGKNKELMEACRDLREYSLFVDKTREFVKKNDGNVDDGIKKAVDWCIANNILREFLQKERSEIIMLSIFEYNAEEERHKLLAEVDENSAQLIEKGKEMERANTEREKQRADAAEARIRELEAKLAEMSK